MHITIGIPFFNNEKTLDLAIKSVINQTYKEWELLLINDGSTDSSIDIVNYYIKNDPRIKLINDGYNRGLVFRLNQIIEISNFELIARMDADDIMLPHRLEKQIEIFNLNKDIDIVASAVYTIDEKNLPIGKRDIKPISLNKPSDIFFKTILVHPTILVKKNWYKVNKYDDQFLRAEDFELWCRSFQKTKFYRIEEPLLLYREGNVNIKNYNKSMASVRKVLILNHHNLNSFKFLKGYISTYLKSVLYILFGQFKMQFLLTSIRNSSLTKDENQYIYNYIQVLQKL